MKSITDMSRDFLTPFIAALMVACLSVGFIGGLAWGHFVTDRDREAVIVEVMQFVDKRWDVQSENTVIARPGPEEK